MAQITPLNDPGARIALKPALRVKTSLPAPFAAFRNSRTLSRKVVEFRGKGFPRIPREIEVGEFVRIVLELPINLPQTVPRCRVSQIQKQYHRHG